MEKDPENQAPKPAKPGSIHDRFLRNMMTRPEVIQEFFQENLPDFIKSVVDFASITPQKDSFVDDALRLQVADLLYTVKFAPDQDGYLYLLVENTSSPSKLLPFRMLKYCLAIWESHQKKHQGKKLPLPVIYPLIFYSGEKPYPYRTDFLDLFGEQKELARRIFHEAFPLVDLTQVPDERLLSYYYFGIMAFLVKHIREKEFFPVLEKLTKAVKVLEIQGERGYIETVFHYIFEAGEVKEADRGALFERIATTFDQGDVIMTIAEQLRQEGWQQGKQEGWQKGQQEGRQQGSRKEKLATARRLLALEIGEETILQVTELSAQELEALKQEKFSA